MLLSCIKRFFILFLLCSIHVVAFAGDAPVYDADNYPPQFDGSEPSSAVSSAVKSEDSFKSQSLTQEQRLARIEQQMKNLTHSDSVSKVETIQTEVQSLRGQVEQLTHQLQQVQSQQRVLYADIDKRLTQAAANKSVPPVSTDDDAGVKKSSAKGSTAAAAAHVTSPKKIASTATPAKITASASSDQPNVAEEQQIYQTAYDLIKVKKYNEAVNTLQKMLQKYPAGQFAANAHYWLGELYGLLNKNDQSAEEFAAVVKNYPDSPKIADAQLKLGLIYAAQFKWPDAKAAFKKVASHYPGTASARLANEQLKQLKQAQAQAQAGR